MTCTSVNVPVSTRHWNVEPASPDENVNTGGLTLVGAFGPVLIVVSGSAVSTVQSRKAGVGSIVPAASMARTRNECGPCDRPV